MIDLFLDIDLYKKIELALKNVLFFIFPARRSKRRLHSGNDPN